MVVLCGVTRREKEQIVKEAARIVFYVYRREERNRKQKLHKKSSKEIVSLRKIKTLPELSTWTYKKKKKKQIT